MGIFPEIQKAAIYVRTATGSVDKQIKALHDYAYSNQFEIIQTYTDEGKNGLTIEGRSGLKQLIDGVQNHCIEFKTILLLNLSRWGRFLDGDEYEYLESIFRNANIEIKYIEENKNNNNKITSIFNNARKKYLRVGNINE